MKMNFSGADSEILFSSGCVTHLYRIKKLASSFVSYSPLGVGALERTLYNCSSFKKLSNKHHLSRSNHCFNPHIYYIKKV
jgi:hypothetical protein